MNHLQLPNPNVTEAYLIPVFLEYYRPRTVGTIRWLATVDGISQNFNIVLYQDPIMKNGNPAR
jgi:hypothetical protein